MLDLSALKGNENIKKILANRTFHSYIIDGGSFSDRKLLSELISMSYFCLAEVKPCRACRECEKFASSNHPDFIRIDGGADVKEMRIILEGLWLSPNDGDYKVYLIENADILSVQVQNVLLKSVEEPPKHAVFIFVCESCLALLQTIRSRCVLLGLSSGNDIIEESGVYLNACDFINCVLKKKFSEILDILVFKNREEQKEFFRLAGLAAKKKLSALISGLLAERCTDRTESYDKTYSPGNDLSFLSFLSDEKQREVKILASLCGYFDEINAKLEYNINMNLWNTYALMRCVDAVSGI